MFRIIFLLMVLFAAPTYGADEIWQNCESESSVGTAVDGTTGSHVTVRDAALCYRLDDASASGALAPSFSTRTTSLACLEPSIDDDAQVCTADILRCTPGQPIHTNGCIKVIDNPLNGTGGGAGTQKRCVRIGAGNWLTTMVKPGAGDFCILSVEIE